jgi:DNA mismatch repair protein MutS
MHAQTTVKSPGSASPRSGGCDAQLSGASFSSALPLHKQFDGYAVLNHSGEQARIIKDAPTEVLSKDSPQFAKLGALHSLIDCTTTRLGSAALLRDLVRPPTSLDVIAQRRAAILELRNNTALREALERALKSTQDVSYMAYSTEEWALRVFTPEVADRSDEKIGFWKRAWIQFQQGLNSDRPTMIRLKALGDLLDLFNSLPSASSTMISNHLSSLKAISASGDRDMLKGDVRKSFFGPIYTSAEAPWYEPTFSAHAGWVSFDQLITSRMGIAAGLICSGYLNISPLLGALPQGMLFFFRGSKVGPRFKAEVRERVCKIPGIFEALDAVGELDALLALSKLPERFGVRCCFPDVIESDTYTLSATNLHNPCQALLGSSVGNDVSLAGGTVKIVTGPNSGGKTTISTAIFQNQILAQLGACVAAESATMSVADKMLFQGPTFAALNDHGRFGTELLATKAIFMQATPKSLVILDEVGDGTTAEERTEMGRAILWGFSRIGCGALLVTHNTALAKRAESEGFAENFHLRMSDDTPTFKIVPGISLFSNAERVARAIGFSEGDIRRSLIDRGHGA